LEKAILPLKICYFNSKFNIKDMKKTLIFGMALGCILGAVITLLILRVDQNTVAEQNDMVTEPPCEQNGSVKKTPYKQKNVVAEPSFRQKAATKIQYVEVRGKKGDVILHTGMLKDSVRILLGKPDEVDLYSIGKTVHEKWGYKIYNKYISDLNIGFEDGKLESIRQN